MGEKNSSVNLNAGHRQRLRKRFLDNGISALAPHEIVELLLTFSIPQKDVKPLAKSLLNRFADLRGIFSAQPDLLMQQPGIKENSAALFKLVYALCENLQEKELNSSDIIANPLAAIRYLRTRIGYENREVMALIFLDNANIVRGCEWSAGKSNRVSFYPQNIARSILQNNASGVIIAHNHPSGVCTPSEADLRSTRMLKDYLEQLDLKLIDHLLITRSTHLSLLNRIGCIFKNYSEPVIDPERFCNESFQKAQVAILNEK